MIKIHKENDDVPLSEIRDLLRKLPGQDSVECADVQEWCSIDKDLVFFETMTDQDIIDYVTSSSVAPPHEEDKEEDDTEDAQIEAKIPTNTEAIEHLEKAILWIKAEDEADQMRMCVLRFLREKEVKQRHNSLKSQSIHFFQAIIIYIYYLYMNQK